jgi:hypothetical protein
MQNHHIFYWRKLRLILKFKKFLIVIFLSFVLKGWGDSVDSNLLVQKKINKGKQAYIFLRKALIPPNFKKFLTSSSATLKKDKPKILYYLLIYENKLPRKILQNCKKILLEYGENDLEVLETFLHVFARRKICSKKLYLKANSANVSTTAIQLYKRRCRW